MRVFGALLAIALAALQQPTAALSQSPANPGNTSQPQVPSPEALTLLIKMPLAGLNQANRTNNYSVLWALGSDTFRKANTPESMSKDFAGMRNAGMDLSGVILLSPQLLQAPAIEQGKYLRLRGFFATQPTRIDFDLLYELSQGQWKLTRLGLSTPPPQTGLVQMAPPQATGAAP